MSLHPNNAQKGGERKMKTLPIAVQSMLKESDRAFEEVLGVMGLDRQKLDQKVKRMRSGALGTTLRARRALTDRRTSHV